MVQVRRSEIRRRQELVAAILGAHVVGGHPLALSAWLRVPGYWTEEGLVRALRERGVAATSSEPFVVEAGEPPNALRICVGGTLTLEALREALEIIAGTFAQYPGINDACFIA